MARSAAHSGGSCHVGGGSASSGGVAAGEQRDAGQPSRERVVGQVVQHVLRPSRSGARPGGSGRWRRAQRGSSGEPGTANSSRPASWARRAVIRLPERSAASTTTTPSARPAMIRLRRGKWRACGRGAERRLGDHGAAFGDAALQIGVLRRVGHGRGRRRPPRRCARSAARRHAPRRRCRAPGRRPPPAAARQLGGQALGHALAVGRGVAAADQGDRAARQQRRVAEHGDDRRRVVQQGQQRRVVRFVRRRCRRAPSRSSASQFALGIVARRDSRQARRVRRRAPAPAARRARPRAIRSGPAGGDR